MEGRRAAWVTGGGRGIGRACALALARDGFDVAITSRSPEDVASVGKEVTKLGRRAYGVRADVSDAKAMVHGFDRVEKELGPVHALVASAGIARSAAFLKTDDKSWESHWRSNVMGTVNAVRAVLPAMVKRGSGRVVAIASVAGKVGAPYTSAYAASKHAVLGVVRSLAAEHPASGVTFNAVCPGYVDTQMTQESVAIIREKTGMSKSDARARLEGMSPQGRLLSPDEVAGLVAYLCRPEAGGINGQAITMDGGAVQW